MNIKVIGDGAAGNKAVIEAIERGVLHDGDYLLINSTLRDIPVNYRDKNCLELLNSTGGCAKERDVAYELAVETLKDHDTQSIFENFITEDTDAVIMVSSTSGGTGSGTSVVIGKWLRKQYGIPVHVFAFTGFENDIVELANTINFFNELDPDFTVEVVSNKKYLEDGLNKMSAEKAANGEFCNKLEIMTGQLLIDSTQNLDDTELYNTVNNPGYSIIEKASLNKLKNIDGFNKILASMIDNTKSLDTSKGVHTLAVILNIKEDKREYIDFSFDAIKNKLGTPMYIFPHVQYDENQEEYVAIIASGMKLPKEELKEVYDKFNSRKDTLDDSEDDFFDNDMKVSLNTGRSRRRGGRRTTLARNSASETELESDDNFLNKTGTIAKNF